MSGFAGGSPFDRLRAHHERCVSLDYGEPLKSFRVPVPQAPRRAEADQGLADEPVIRRRKPSVVVRQRRWSTPVPWSLARVCVLQRPLRLS
jgi:hypothetical protein